MLIVLFSQQVLLLATVYETEAQLTLGYLKAQCVNIYRDQSVSSNGIENMYIWLYKVTKSGQADVDLLAVS